MSFVKILCVSYFVCLFSIIKENHYPIVEKMGPEIGMKEDLMLKDLKGALSGLRQFLVNENPLKIVKNAIYFTLKALFVFKIFTLFILTVRSCIKTA